MYSLSTIGKKIIVALTGLILFGFVVGHLLGNLQVFAGAEKINAYSEFLHHAPFLLWGTRIVLLVSVVLHIGLTLSLAKRNKDSRPVDYDRKETIQATWASRFMIWSGVFLGVYIVYHLLHMTFGVVHPRFRAGDVYSNLVTGLSVPWVAAFYVLGLVALGAHLAHGVWSVFQTLGLNHPSYNRWRRVLAVTAAFLIAAGYITIPVAIVLGWVR